MEKRKVLETIIGKGNDLEIGKDLDLSSLGNLIDRLRDKKDPKLGKIEKEFSAITGRRVLNVEKMDKLEKTEEAGAPLLLEAAEKLADMASEREGDIASVLRGAIAEVIRLSKKEEMEVARDINGVQNILKDSDFYTIKERGSKSRPVDISFPVDRKGEYVPTTANALAKAVEGKKHTPINMEVRIGFSGNSKSPIEEVFIKPDNSIRFVMKGKNRESVILAGAGWVDEEGKDADGKEKPKNLSMKIDLLDGLVGALASVRAGRQGERTVIDQDREAIVQDAKVLFEKLPKTAPLTEEENTFIEDQMRKAS